MKKLLLAVIAVLALFTSCKEEEDTITRIEIVEGETINLEVWDEIRLHFKCYPEHLKTPQGYKWYQWSSSNFSVATVNNSGEVKCESAGETVITITTTDNISASCRIVVTPMEVNITNINLETTEYEMIAGEIIQLNPQVSPFYTKDTYTLKYTSTNEAVAKVGNDGKIEAVNAGECQIKIETADTKVTHITTKVSTICNITVIPDEVTNIALNNNDLIIDKGESYKFEVAIEPEKVTDKTIKWSSSDESVATIGEDGTLIGVGYGMCTITAISSNANVKAECIVKVSTIRSFELSKTNAKILIGSTDVITAYILPATANQNVIWTSSDESIATVEKGVVTGIATGTATITATTEDGGFEQKCEATVGGIDIFMSASHYGGMSFSNGGNKAYCNCSISNNSNADIFAKSVTVSGVTYSVNEIVRANSMLSVTANTNQFNSTSYSNVWWTIEYNGTEYYVSSSTGGSSYNDLLDLIGGL